jgi:hypothetical protein
LRLGRSVARFLTLFLNRGPARRAAGPAPRTLETVSYGPRTEGNPSPADACAASLSPPRGGPAARRQAALPFHKCSAARDGIANRPATRSSSGAGTSDRVLEMPALHGKEPHREAFVDRSAGASPPLQPVGFRLYADANESGGNSSAGSPTRRASSAIRVARTTPSSALTCLLRNVSSAPVTVFHTPAPVSPRRARRAGDQMRRGSGGRSQKLVCAAPRTTAE